MILELVLVDTLVTPSLNFVSPRGWFCREPCKIMLDGKTRYARDRGSWQSNIDSYNINSRGWIMQERLLSPRILYYTKDQIIWECNEGLASESLPDILPRTSEEASLFNRLIHNSSSDDTEQSPALSNDDIRKAWNLLISRYSRVTSPFSFPSLLVIHISFYICLMWTLR